ncbi:hypothetical protein PAAG_11524 [Paracoccidioides lutzii Pb01]|uniref:Ubiquitin-like domain-containing protein n=1 Tax=Paracoccidioides lutzii (strain ATCC MYA-826 / Pb01) TaxID=502779 RepID=A0A0A2VLH2_PARBA|nr:hypothetical protein PAAG_11524 [Paracoccidioides lutzii Pb01]KGQ01679.1 hypothetical protein PAAG_11524 [Paracoccidioides lutzii Pb01]
MSLCSTVHPTVTSSCLFKPLTAQLPRRICPLRLRAFSSYGSSCDSSKRKLQIATAYQPYTLPESFPPPRNTGVTGSSITDGYLVLNGKWQSRPAGQPQPSITNRFDKESSIGVPKSEAQKSTPVASASPSTPSETDQSQTPRKAARRSRLKARKAALTITPEAVSHLRKLIDQPDPKLIRVGVKNRGCSGLSYNLEYVDKPAPFDEVVEQDGVKILVDSKALFSIIGSEMDWQEDKLASRFVFKNPNINHTFLLPTDLCLLTIRFSASIPDVLLEIPEPARLTAAGLKQLIRQRLPRHLSTHRLRLIYAGKALEDSSSLASALNIASQPTRYKSPAPPRDANYLNDKDKCKGKGKAPVREPPTPPFRTYIHCSVGDIILSAAELEAEARLTQVNRESHGHGEGKGENKSGLVEVDVSLLGPPNSLSPLSSSTSAAPTLPGTLSAAHGQSSGNTSQQPLTTGPRGFDRLLEAGFTPAEVSALRSQFLALQSLSHTPDTMPSGAELRRLEDIWMDEGGPVGSSETLGGNGGPGVGGGISNDVVGGNSGALDDMLWGSVMGFFWPVGCGLWLLREQGVWSWRKGLAVFVGVVVNLGFGVVRILN